jgi:hypothetical protein
MRCKLLLCLLFAFSALAGKAQQLLSGKINIAAGGASTRNALFYLPASYSENTAYPLVVYLHGMSQAGTDVNKLYKTGLPKVLKDGYRPSFDFIMVAPQSDKYGVDPAWLPHIMTDAQSRWAIDTNRVYLTGIDAGGWAAYGSQLNISAAFAKKIAAIVAISGATQNSILQHFDWWKKSQTPLWAITGSRDKAYGSLNAALADTLNKTVPGLAASTVLSGVAHGGWDAVYKGAVLLQGKSIWEWLYQFDRSKPFSKAHAGAPDMEKTTSAITGGTTQYGTESGTLRIEAEAYTAMSGIQTQATTDAGGGENVGWIDEGDWMNYSVAVAPAGSYTVKIRVAANSNGARFRIKNSSGTTLSLVDIPNTGGFQTWQTIVATIKLAAGAQSVQFQSDNPQPWNVNWFDLAESGAGTSETETGGLLLNAGTKIEAEDFFDRYGILKQTTRDFAGGGYNLFDVSLGDWVSYKVNAPAAGQYTINFRVACNADGSRFQVQNSQGSALTTVNVPNTNGWQTWRDVTAVINLNAGMQAVKLKATTTTGWNLNFFEITKTPQNAFANYTLRPNSGSSIYLPHGLNLAHLKPGDTLNIPAGGYNVIELGNFRGSATQPIIIQNRGGQVTCKIIRLSNTPEHFRLLGNGHQGLTYGFKINGESTTGSCLTTFGAGIEIAYVEGMFSRSGFFIKKNPSADDPQSQHPNYLMDRIYIHHNYLHDITGEGMYIGHTAADGGQDGNPLLPVRMRNVEIAYNLVNKTGWDGIQLANATTGNSIHHNTVTNFGTANRYGQQAGILLGGNSMADIYNNTVKSGTGNGIQHFGFGLNKIYNNNLENVGRNKTERGYEAVYCNDIIVKSETRSKQQIQAYNNTIKYPMPWGAIRVSGYNENSLPATMQFNKVLLPNAPSNWERLYFLTYVPNSVISGNTLIKQ